jgi:hypothetical protein
VESDGSRWKARAEQAESALAKAVTIIKLGLDVVSEERGWGTYPRMEGSEIYTDAAAFSEPARAFIAEHGPEST